MRGWLPLYRLSVRLGLRHLLRQGPYTREALIRVLIPLDPSRYLELPQTLVGLGALPGEHVLDLASPKLLAVALARSGADVTSLDLHTSEVEAWRGLAGGQRRLRFQIGDGRELGFADATFDHAYSVSVLEHIADGGDEQALRELARVVRPGGRVLLTLPYAERYREDWRDQPVYGEQRPGPNGRYFFERWYDNARLERLLAAAPELRVFERHIVRMQPNWHLLYQRWFPWLIALGPLYGLLGRERTGPPGDVVRLSLERAPQGLERN
jgi:SAM-dependent methyltransferase